MTVVTKGARGAATQETNKSGVELVVTPKREGGSGVFHVTVKGTSEKSKTLVHTSPRSVALASD